MNDNVKHDAREIRSEIAALLLHLDVMIEHGDARRVTELAAAIEAKAHGLSVAAKPA